MKKIVIRLTVFVVCFLCFGLVVSAAGALEINCKNSIAPGEQVTCDIIGTTDDASFAGAEFVINSDDVLTVSEPEIVRGFTGGYNSADNKVSFAGTGVASGSTIATIIVKANENASIGQTASIEFSEVVVATKDSNGNAVNNPIANVSHNFTIGESNTSGGGNEPADAGDTSGDETQQDNTQGNNPKTMDLSTTIILAILAGATFVVVIGKKRLNKLSK